MKNHLCSKQSASHRYTMLNDAIYGLSKNIDVIVVTSTTESQSSPERNQSQCENLRLIRQSSFSQVYLNAPSAIKNANSSCQGDESFELSWIDLQA
jgi:hypothetical protein